MPIFSYWQACVYFTETFILLRMPRPFRISLLGGVRIQHEEAKQFQSCQNSCAAPSLTTSTALLWDSDSDLLRGFLPKQSLGSCCEQC